MLVTAHVRTDDSLLMEGEAGDAVAAVANVTTPQNGGPITRWVATRRTPFRAGWRATPALIAAGYRMVSAEFDPVGAGEVVAGYALVGGVLTRLTAPAPPALLTRPRLKLFLKLAGMLDLYAVLAETLAASTDATEALAGFTALDGTEFTFAEVVGQAAAALAAMPEPIEGAPDLGDPAAVGALRAAWDAAATQELPA